MSTSEELKTKGNEAFAKKEFKKAAKLYRDAIKLEPSNSILYSNRAICFIKLNDWQRAIDDCIYALSLPGCDNKTRIKLMWRHSIALIEIGSTHDALNVLNEALLLDPTNTALNKEKTKVLDLLQNRKRKRENSSTILLETVPIEIVDELPLEFQKKNVPKTIIENTNIREKNLNTYDEFEKELMQIEGVVVPKHTTERDEAIPKTETTRMKFDPDTFPENPSVFFLSCLKNQPNRESYYDYLVTIKPQYFEKLFKSIGLDADFLALYADASLYYLNGSQSKEQLDNIIDNLKLFPSFSRFSIASLFLSKVEILELFDIIRSLRSAVNLKEIWKW